MFKWSKDKKDAVSGPLDVALIGCGPGGMMFLHALNKAKKEGGELLPNVTCFERASSSGGVWRDVPADDKGRSKPENGPLMYDDLWSNTPKELFEFHDYTFDEHFKKPTPSFLPRKDILAYLIARNAADGALDAVKFNHTVQSVTSDDKSGKFSVTVKDDQSGSTSTNLYDRVIWAAGIHGIKEEPEDVLSVLKDYTGKVMHSMDATENFEADVKGKNILLVGDSSSAEDLALRAIKLGAKHVYISARSGEGDASETTSWPGGKVTVIYGPPCKVLKGTGIKCQAVYWSDKRQKFRKDDDEDPVKIKDIATIVLCTGYEANLACVDEALQFDDEGADWTLSKGWKMDNNAFTISVGTVTPSKALGPGSTCYPDIYRGLLISNPNMMYIAETEDPACPLFDLEVNANLILAYLMEKAEIPKEKDMLKANQKQLEMEMQNPFLRMAIDMAYAEEVNELENHWSEDPNDERVVILTDEVAKIMTNVLARNMKAANYPVDFGDGKKLSPLGEKYASMLVAKSKCRTELKNSSDSTWMTFRDTRRSEFASLFTDTKPVPLSGHWMEVSGNKLD